PDRTDPARWGHGAQDAMTEARAYAACLAIVEGRRTPFSLLERVEELHASSCPRCPARDEMSRAEHRAAFGDKRNLSTTQTAARPDEGTGRAAFLRKEAAMDARRRGQRMHASTYRAGLRAAG